jgi:hypothetical protein
LWSPCGRPTRHANRGDHKGRPYITSAAFYDAAVLNAIRLDVQVKSAYQRRPDCKTKQREQL